MTQPASDEDAPQGRFLTEDRTSVLADYPRACPRCQGRLPLTRARFPLRFSAKSAFLLTCGVVLATVSACLMIPLIVLVGGGGLWIPGASMIEKGLGMRREYAVTCEHCGFSFRVEGPGVE
jgi:hypothetical protein